MENYTSIILVLCATIINSIVFGYVASNTKNNKINTSYLIFLTFIILYTIFDCIIIQIFESIEIKNIIVRIQALFWMPLSILFLNFVYLFLKKQKDTLYYYFIIFYKFYIHQFILLSIPLNVKSLIPCLIPKIQRVKKPQFKYIYLC